MRHWLLSYVTLSFFFASVTHHASQAGRGGHVIVFQGVIPTLGMGRLEPVNMESNLHKTEKEKILYSPRDVFWRNIADECADEGVGISMFLAPSSFLDVASISESVRSFLFLLGFIEIISGYPVSVTGGELFYHPRFNPERDSRVLFGQLGRLLQRRTVYNCMMRVRCSNGLSHFSAPLWLFSHLVFRTQGCRAIRQLP